jgi:hypothetical protein
VEAGGTWLEFGRAKLVKPYWKNKLTAKERLEAGLKCVELQALNSIPSTANK